MLTAKTLLISTFFIIPLPPQTDFVGEYTVFTLSIHPFVRPSVMFRFFNIFKSFIKPCMHIHIYRANT